MKRFAFPLLIALLVALWSTGCDSVEGEDPSGVVTLQGRVADALTGDPISDAVIEITPSDLPPLRSDSTGFFSAQVEIDSTTSLRVQARKTNYTSSVQEVVVAAGMTETVPTLRLQRSSDAEVESGTPSNILLLTQSRGQIGIIGSGAPEVARITYQVTDSAGTPITLDNGAYIRFKLGQKPGGGEFIAPREAPTNNDGKVTVNLSSGTRAGTVQIVAEADVNGRTIRSNPVSVAIHGGLPDYTHFSLGPAQFNFAGLRRYGVTNELSVIVGDKYSNPVKPGTAVYFETTHGVIEGSVQTNDQGQGTVTLASANPLPPDGIAVITASTANEDEQTISRETPVVFSGAPVITVEPTVPELGQTYTLTVEDQNGNPLAPGTTINVKAEGTKVKATGNTGVTLDDTIIHGSDGAYVVQRGQGITQFTFRVVDDLRVDETGNPTLETITILVSGPNGEVEIVLTNSGATAGKNATVEQRLDGSAVIQLAL